MNNEEVHDLYSAPNIIQLITSWRIGWAGYAARMGRRKIYAGFSWGKRLMGDTGVDRRKILKWLLNE